MRDAPATLAVHEEVDEAENVAIIRRFCLNLARLDGKKNSMRGKLKQAGWIDTRRAEILFGESS